MLVLCKLLTLPVSEVLISNAIEHPPDTLNHFRTITTAWHAEIKSKLFLFVPDYRAKYFEMDDIISDKAKTAFPSAYEELRQAGNAFALSLPTACVFHSARAAEIGVRALGTALGVTFPYPIELADIQNILEQAESKIGALKNLPKSASKDEDLKFYSESAIHFRYFKDAWRVRVAHARASYSEAKALEVLDHARVFFDELAVRLFE
jgi:hypothetical protein